MKIEKLNDNQIRCTLTRADLASRELKLSELICGSEKAKTLFQDMMKQAALELGFEAEDMPLMIEAIPSSSDSIVLIITKVDDPEELDSRFSKLGAALGDSDGKNREGKGKITFDKNMLDKLEGADRLLDLFHKIKKTLQENALPDELAEKSSEDSQTAKIRLFSFSSLDNVIRACKLLGPMYQGANTLYKDVDNLADKHAAESANAYILALTQTDHSSDEFYRICNMLSEFGTSEKVTPAVLAFLEEHCEVIVSVDAVQKLSAL